MEPQESFTSSIPHSPLTSSASATGVSFRANSTPYTISLIGVSSWEIAKINPFARTVYIPSLKSFELKLTTV